MMVPQKCYRVKVFSASAQAIEKQINDWIEQSKGIEIKDFVQSSTFRPTLPSDVPGMKEVSVTHNPVLSITFLYEEKEGSNKE